VKIKYNENAAPHLRGTTAHLPPALAASLVATGFAEPCPLPRRGSPGWTEARLEQSRENAGSPNAGDTAVPFTEGVEWGVRDKQHADGEPLIIRRSGFVTTHFNARNIPKDCPSSIIDKFLRLRNAPGASAEALAEAKRKQDAYNAQLQGAKRW